MVSVDVKHHVYLLIASKHVRKHEARPSRGERVPSRFKRFWVVVVVLFLFLRWRKQRGRL